MSIRWLDFRALALAFVLAVAAALPSVTTSVDHREFYFFDVTLTSNTVGSTQFFWDAGKGFSEYNSSRQPIRIEPTPVVYRFMMPMGRFTALRFDPVDGIGEFTLAHARIVDYRGRIVKAFAPEDLLPGGGIRHVAGRGEILDVYTDPASNDPIINLRLREPLELKSNPAIWWRLGAPMFGTVFALGALLSLRPIAERASRLLARLLEVAKRYPGYSIALTAALVVAIQCHPVIFQGRSFASPNNGAHMLYQDLPALPGDTEDTSTNTASSDTGALMFQHLYYPMVQRDALLAGELPLWNRYSLAGEPLLGQGQSMFGDPFNFLTIASDGAAWAWDVRFLIARWILAAALGGVVWRLTRHVGAALLTSVGMGFIGFFTYRLVHPANFSVCYAPTILLAWTYLIDATTSRRLLTGLAAVVGANWLTMTSGTMKEAYMLIVGLNFAGALLLLRPGATPHRWFILKVTSAAGVGFMLLSAPLWVSFLSAWSHSMTGYDTPHADTLPLTQVIGFFDDIFYRQTAKEESVVAPALNFLFLAAVLWRMIGPRPLASTPVAGVLLFAMLPPFALAFGIVPPAMIEKIPFVGNIVHVGNTFSCVLMVLVAAFGGLGFHAMWKATPADHSWTLLARYWAALGALLGAYFYATRTADRSPFFIGYASAVITVTALLPLVLRWARNQSRASAPLMVALALGIPLLCWRHCQYRSSDFDRYTFVPGPRSDLHAMSPALEAIKRDQTQPGRANGWGSILYASYNTVPRLEGVYGVDAVRSRHYHDLADALGLERVWNWDWPNSESHSSELVRKYDLYNVTHWLATRQGSNHPIAGLRQIASADLDVYVSPTAWPRAFFCDHLSSYALPADFADMLMNSDGRPFVAVQASDRIGTGEALRQNQPSASREIRAARDYRLRPNTTAFTIDAPRAGFAVLTETYYLDDFEVTLNGRRVEYFRVNHAFKGIQIPAAGTYEVTFHYWPKHFTGALWAALAGAILLGLGAIWLWRRPPLLLPNA